MVCEIKRNTANIRFQKESYTGYRIAFKKNGICRYFQNSLLFYKIYKTINDVKSRYLFL